MDSDLLFSKVDLSLIIASSQYNCAQVGEKYMSKHVDDPSYVVLEKLPEDMTQVPSF